ncbi:hypothetical protein RD1_A0104 (plasmid) [Roseobacter denitrificans OCh 114]|uniref:Uncharacterized protein n=1 Tax=Roseobacter denitrificans (strain ATCC 33942 / OCh 114) TaxID=375451 RepID=Q07GJ9_ROSDO|nr:hypothetical protein RD1_A0104 [Roseobacter denitrificans OCh 114]
MFKFRHGAAKVGCLAVAEGKDYAAKKEDWLRSSKTAPLI